jgi:hypothetical protein
MRTDSDLAQPALIRLGVGIAVCQVAIAPRDAALVWLLPKEFSLPLETWVTMHELPISPHIQPAVEPETD